MSIRDKAKVAVEGFRRALFEQYPLLKLPITALIGLTIVMGIGGVVFKILNTASDKIADRIGNTIWTCNGFVPVTYLIMPPSLRTPVD